MDVFNNRFLQELLNYGDNKSMEIKVRRVYHKAIRARKIALADRIEEKYRRYLPKSDMVMAMEIVLRLEKTKYNPL